jgi:hypothetical protein
MRALLAFCLALAVAPLAHADVPPAPDAAEARVEQLLTAMGGRDVWASIRSMQNVATQYSTQVDEPYKNLIWNDFDSPRIRIEQSGPAMNRMRAFSDDKGWRVRDGEPSLLTAEEIAEERKFWEANVYRTLHRLARRDADLHARLTENGRLEIVRADGVRLCWFDLNAKGEPYAFGTWDGDIGSVFGPLIEAAHGRIRVPAWGASSTGAWRYVIERIEVYEGAPPASFDPPEGVVFPAP